MDAFEKMIRNSKKPGFIARISIAVMMKKVPRTADGAKQLILYILDTSGIDPHMFHEKAQSLVGQQREDFARRFEVSLHQKSNEFLHQFDGEPRFRLLLVAELMKIVQYMVGKIDRL